MLKLCQSLNPHFFRPRDTHYNYPKRPYMFDIPFPLYLGGHCSPTTTTARRRKSSGTTDFRIKKLWRTTHCTTEAPTARNPRAIRPHCFGAGEGSSGVGRTDILVRFHLTITVHTWVSITAAAGFLVMMRGFFALLLPTYDTTKYMVPVQVVTTIVAYSYKPSLVASQWQ
jgi:hypothetical protein